MSFFRIRILGLGTATHRYFSDLNRTRMREAMENSLQIILNSTLVGYVTRRSPQGDPWDMNPAWWQQMKGQKSPNVGPVSKTIQGGPFAKTYELARVNPKRMKNSLVKNNQTFTGTVQYDAEAKARAQRTQHGGAAILRLRHKTTGRTLAFNVNILSRPHLGIATYPRVGSRTDAEWIELYFGDQVELQLRDDTSINPL